MAKRTGTVHVATTTRQYKGKVYTSHLLRRSYRDPDGKVKHQTLGNLSHLPDDLIQTIRQRLKGESIGNLQQMGRARSYPHGHVAAVLGVLDDLGLKQLLGSRGCRERDLVVAMIVARILNPGSKLATAQALADETAQHSLGLELGLDTVDADELYEAMDWLQKRQTRIENKLAHRHLQEGTLLLYDVSGSYYTGRCSDLVQHGHPRDGKKRFPQILYGLLCNREGCPIAIEVFSGNTGDPATLGSQIRKVRQRFGIQRVIMVGDRGLITSRRIDQEMRDVEGLQWITALRSEQIRSLVAAGTIAPSLFDERDLAEVNAPDYPGERLIVCRNPALAEERARKRALLLARTETHLEQIAEATRRARRPLRGQEKIAVRVGRVLERSKVAKHFEYEIREDHFTYWRKQEKIQQEAALDGLYVVRTPVDTQTLGAEDVVRSYKGLSKVERAFRCMKSMDLKIRPIHHFLDHRIRGHVFLCMLAYYVEWHMRQRLAPILFEDHQRDVAEAERSSIVSPAPRSDAAKAKDASKRTGAGGGAGEPVLSFQNLLAHLATLTKDRLRVGESEAELYMCTDPTPLQKRAFDLLDLPTPA